MLLISAPSLHRMQQHCRVCAQPKAIIPHKLQGAHGLGKEQGTGRISPFRLETHQTPEVSVIKKSIASLPFRA